VLRPNDITSIINKINNLEAERADWLKTLASAKGVQRRLAQTALTQIEARLRWYRGRAEGKKPARNTSYQDQKARAQRNRARLSEVRA
jgi:hypothetical protein